VPAQTARKRPLLGALKGQFGFDERVFDPLPADGLAAWYDGKI